MHKYEDSPEPVPMQEEFKIPEEAALGRCRTGGSCTGSNCSSGRDSMYREEEPEASVETPEEHTSAIKQVVTGGHIRRSSGTGCCLQAVLILKKKQ